MQCLHVAGTTTGRPIRRDVCLWEVKNEMFACGWDHE